MTKGKTNGTHTHSLKKNPITPPYSIGSIKPCTIVAILKKALTVKTTEAQAKSS